MDTGKLDKWAELLLDTGKRNNLINFKDTKLGTVEIAAPSYTVLFNKADRDTKFEVYDPDADKDEYDIFFDDDETVQKKFANKQDYIVKYEWKIKGNQILLWNPYGPIAALSTVAKKASTAMEETGVNIAYMAFGFVHWFEENDPETTYRAPLLLIPVKIEKKARTENFKIKPTGDDVVLNPTFCFKLQSEYGVTLPEYTDEGIEKYFDAVGEIFAKLKWTLTRECKIGIFSFLKINMYRDLKDNADEILENRNIRILLGEPVEEQVPIKETESITAQRNVVDADSSQAEAVALAKTGQSFVLQGPPGTGKSQTITNLIAECISDGKKVLFVSEKLAALNVVYDKLKKAGLAEFCLELHSHKANKKEVIAELCRTLRLPKNGVAAEAAEYTDELMRAQDKLCEYEKQLHTKRPVINKTLYEIFGEISRLREAADCDLIIEGVQNKGEEFLNDAADAFAQYAQYVPSIGEDYTKNVWYGYKVSDGSYSSKIKLKSELQTLSSALEQIIFEKDEFEKSYQASSPTVSSLFSAQRFFALAANSKYLAPELLCADAAKTTHEKLNSALALYKEFTQAKAYLDERYDDDIYKLDGAAYYKLLTKKYGGAFSRLFSKEYKNIRSEIRLCRRDNKKPSYAEAVVCAKNLATFKAKSEEFEALANGLTAPDIKSFAEADFTAAISEFAELEKIFSEGFDSGNIRFMAEEEFTAEKRNFAAVSRSLEKCLSAFGGALDFVAGNFEKSEFDFYLITAEAARDKAFGCLDDIDGLDNWLAFYNLLQRLEKLQLTQFLQLTADGVPADHLAEAFKKAYFKQWADYIIHSSEALSALTRIPHDKAVESFASTDRLQFEINKAKIRAKLSSMRPSTTMVTAGSAASVLLREGEKKRRQKSIRALLSEAGGLIQVLKPCFLMSPLSVSTFLESSKIRFDTVIFDEASQIFPQDAAGAIYRGKQLIVVGDSRQMPPSNFFNAVADAPEDDWDGVTDFESILDLCSTALPQKRLKWHYRSRYEQLISFSNKNFYDFELVTFPSCRQDKNKDGIGVDFHYIEGGTFDHKTKTNVKEAEYVVDLIYDNFKKYPERSLGVVAFSISQQNLIERLLNRRRAKEQDMEEFFKADAAEPFFIKNLETVQGDERDTIIFSVGYAKDETGKLLHNFGPLNRVGGERRLNVAITRAKHNVQVVASMKYTAIDLKRTRSEGARLLRDYLDYAENGETSFYRAEGGSFEKPRLDLQKEVCEFLIANGFKADMQVGCSGMKIDVAVRDKNGENYVLAVECDGESYHSGKSARDRDRLRREVLERMGWRFYRLWSADWIRTNKAEKERLLFEAQAAVNGKGKPSLNSKQTEEVKKNYDITPDGERGETAASAETAKNISSFISAAEDKPFEFPEYKTADIPALRRKYPNDFISFVKAMLETEAPLAETVLLQRIAFMFNYYGKVTPTVVREYNTRMRRAAAFGIIRRNGFLYLDGQKEIPFRRFGGKHKREVKEVSLEELASGMRTLLKLNVSVDREGLFREIINQLGFNRLTEPLKQRLNDALKLLDGETQTDGNRITLI
ncbi:MAG: DUF4011 domain-containing protein [Clostridia bacterium]|nr:DUF4011 domain-containing protein [Clostridia bacterium]